MKGYKIPKGIANALTKQKFKGYARYHPVEDINGDFFIFEEEFKHSQVGEEVEFVPKEIVVPE